MAWYGAWKSHIGEPCLQLPSEIRTSFPLHKLVAALSYSLKGMAPPTPPVLFSCGGQYPDTKGGSLPTSTHKQTTSHHLKLRVHLMDFQFVDHTSIDKTTRKQIRSHVMKGKNAGRTLKRGSRVQHHQDVNMQHSQKLIPDTIMSGYSLRLRRISDFPHIANFSPDNQLIVHQCKRILF